MTGSDVEQLESRDRPRGHCRVGEGACHRPCEVAAAGPIDRRGGQGAERGAAGHRAGPGQRATHRATQRGAPCKTYELLLEFFIYAV